MKTFRQIRLARDITQTQLAKLAGPGVTQQDISDMERGRNRNPSAIAALGVSKALGISIEYLLNSLRATGRRSPGNREGFGVSEAQTR